MRGRRSDRGNELAHRRRAAEHLTECRVECAQARKLRRVRPMLVSDVLLLLRQLLARVPDGVRQRDVLRAQDQRARYADN